MNIIEHQSKFFTEDSYTYKDVTVWILSSANISQDQIEPPT